MRGSLTVQQLACHPVAERSAGEAERMQEFRKVGAHAAVREEPPHVLVAEHADASLGVVHGTDLARSTERAVWVVEKGLIDLQPRARHREVPPVWPSF